MIDLEERLRTWPAPGQTKEIDGQAAALGVRFRRAPEWAQAEAFSALEFIRLKQEPTAGELVRCGVPVSVALQRVDLRAEQHRRIFRGG